MVSDTAVGIVTDYPVVAAGVEATCCGEGVCVVFKDSFYGALDGVSGARTADALLVDVGHGAGSGPLELCPRLAEVAAPAPLIGFLAYTPVGLGAVALLDRCLAGLISLIDSPA